MLTDTQIRNAKTGDKPVKLNDGKGLFVEIRSNGSKLWRYRYRYRYEINGKENLFAVGDYSQPPAGETEEQGKERREGRRFTLSEARAERERCRGLVKQGIHPAHQQRTETMRRTTESASTFKAVAETWIAERESMVRELHPTNQTAVLWRCLPAHWRIAYQVRYSGARQRRFKARGEARRTIHSQIAAHLDRWRFPVRGGGIDGRD